MKTLKIKIRDSRVLKLLLDLEALNLIEVIKPGARKSAIKLSKILRGSISPEQADIMHKELKQMRD